MTNARGDRVSIRIGGDVSGQFVVGDENVTTTTSVGSPVSQADLDTLTALLNEVRTALAGESDAVRNAGLAKLDEFEEAITEDEPDLATMEHVRGWFVRRIPALADAVGRIVLHPVVTRLVNAAGDTIAAEFRRRFGG
jgi:hypothetical protein